MKLRLNLNDSTRKEVSNKIREEMWGRKELQKDGKDENENKSTEPVELVWPSLLPDMDS